MSCSAEQPRLVKKLGSAVGAAALALAIGLSQVDAAKADIAGLTPCSQSKAYAKRQKNELKSLQKRLKNVSADLFSSPPPGSFNQDSTYERRTANQCMSSRLHL